MSVVIAILLFLILLVIAPEFVVRLIGITFGLCIWAVIVGGGLLLILAAGQ